MDAKNMSEPGRNQVIEARQKMWYLDSELENVWRKFLP